jgi:hypothetical protein
LAKNCSLNTASTLVWLFGFINQRDLINLAADKTMNFNHKFSSDSFRDSGWTGMQIPVLLQVLKLAATRFDSIDFTKAIELLMPQQDNEKVNQDWFNSYINELKNRESSNLLSSRLKMPISKFAISRKEKLLLIYHFRNSISFNYS